MSQICVFYYSRQALSLNHFMHQFCPHSGDTGFLDIVSYFLKSIPSILKGKCIHLIISASVRVDPGQSVKGHPQDLLFFFYICPLSPYYVIVSTTLRPSQAKWQKCPALDFTHQRNLLVHSFSACVFSHRAMSQKKTQRPSSTWDPGVPCSKDSETTSRSAFYGGPASGMYISKTQGWLKGGCLWGSGCSRYEVTYQRAEDPKKPQQINFQNGINPLLQRRILQFLGLLRHGERRGTFTTLL